MNNIEKDIQANLNEKDVERKFASEFDRDILFDLNEYLFKSFQCQRDDLIALLDEMRTSYVLHRLDDESSSTWFVKVKTYIDEFAALRQLQSEYNSLIDKKSEILKKMGNEDTTNVSQQKIDDSTYVSLLVNRLRSEYDELNVSRSFLRYEKKINQLSSVIAEFKEKCIKLEHKFNISQSDIKQLRDENKHLKNTVNESKTKSSLIKNKFNDTLNRFADESKAIKINSAQREKELTDTIIHLNKQVDYWKNEYPKKILQHFDDEFKKKILIINSYFEQKSNKLNDFYANKIETLREKDQTLFDKYNSAIDGYEKQKDNLLLMLNNKSVRFEKEERKLQKRITLMRERYKEKLDAEKRKLKAAKEDYKIRIESINRANNENFQEKLERAVNRIVRARMARISASQNGKLLKIKETEAKVFPKDETKTSVSPAPQRVRKNSIKMIKIKKNDVNSPMAPLHLSVENATKNNTENAKSNKRVVFDIIDKSHFGLQNTSSLKDLTISTTDNKADQILAAIRKKTQKKQ